MRTKKILFFWGFLVMTQLSIAQTAQVDTLRLLIDLMNQVMMHGSGAGDHTAEQHRIDSIRNRIETKYKPGASLSDFQFTDIHGKKISFKDLKGKYMYIDVWATWCGPCQREIPFLQKLEEHMAGKNIVFVSISIDSKKQNWEKTVKENNMGGIQLYAGQDKNFITEFGIETIPRFMLIDKEGKVVKIYMFRPSEPETEKLLMELDGI